LAILSRCGVIRTKTHTSAEPETLVQLTLAEHEEGEDCHARRL
jgi:hypothetical protein